MADHFHKRPRPPRITGTPRHRCTHCCSSRRSWHTIHPTQNRSRNRRRRNSGKCRPRVRRKGLQQRRGTPRRVPSARSYPSNSRSRSSSYRPTNKRRCRCRSCRRSSPSCLGSCRRQGNSRRRPVDPPSRRSRREIRCSSRHRKSRRSLFLALGWHRRRRCSAGNCRCCNPHRSDNVVQSLEGTLGRSLRCSIPCC
jgi:hypothetical protein